MSKVIALHGPYGVGKDTVADAFCKVHPNFMRVGFGDSVWRAVASSLDVDVKTVMDRYNKDCEQDRFSLFYCQDGDFRKWAVAQGHDLYAPRNTRFYAVEYGGTYLLRNDKLIWVKNLLDFMAASPEQDYIISDLRTYDDLREYTALSTFCSEVGRDFACVELTKEGRSYTRNKDNARLPEYLIHATVENREGNILGAVGGITEAIKARATT